MRGIPEFAGRNVKRKGFIVLFQFFSLFCTYRQTFLSIVHMIDLNVGSTNCRNTVYVHQFLVFHILNILMAQFLYRFGFSPVCSCCSFRFLYDLVE